MVSAIYALENNLVGRSSIAKINLVSVSNMKNNLMVSAGVLKINLESKGLKSFDMFALALTVFKILKFQNVYLEK